MEPIKFNSFINMSSLLVRYNDRTFNKSLDNTLNLAFIQIRFPTNILSAFLYLLNNFDFIVLFLL